ncbi:unnamed protein product [Paramecium primaurelia]|uniref:Trichocyst matrix protein n=1 Tax=Paramecium primaurelia TaxID=5886 RepID=A0A8S1NT34_PARPR|nr:unnamed protein product [Paramecium primaurelia]
MNLQFKFVFNNNKKRKILLLVLISLALCKLGTDPKIFLTEIDDHHMGKTFLKAIQISLATGSPVHKIHCKTIIYNILNHLIFKFNCQSQQLQGITLDSCQNKNKKIQIYLFKIHKLLVIDYCMTFSTNLAYHQSQLKAHQKIVSVEIEENTKKTNAGQSERDLQYAEFQLKIKDHTEAISAIDEANAVIEHLSGGSSFIQVKGRFNKVLQRLQSQSTGLLFQPILTMLIQLSSKLDTDTDKKVLQLLANLRVQIVDSKGNDETIEKQQSLKCQQFLADLTNEKNTLSDQRQNLEQAILNYQSIIEESEGKVEYHAVEVERNQNNLEGQDQWCRQQQDIYYMETQSRVQTQDLISRISGHIQDIIVTLKEYLRERLQQN